MKLSQKLLHELFDYDPTEPFALRWKNPPRKSHIKPGTIAGGWHATRGQSPIMQRRVKIGGEDFQVARVVWMLVKATPPPARMGYLDDDRGNCRIDNLIPLKRKSPAEYMAKAKARGVKGEAWSAYLRRRNLKRAYGITPEEWDALYEAQGGVCAICKKPETMTRHGRTETLSLDHCHASKCNRGLLCTNCNNLLGRAKDDPAILRAAADYLEGHQVPRAGG